MKSKKKVYHGLSRTPEYRIYQTMLQRCYNPKSISFHNYGERGIRVCRSWRKSFFCFITDVGRRPSREFSLDRLNNNKGYFPNNVRWATKTEQCCNTRRNRFIAYKGVQTTVSQLVKESVVNQNVLRRRILHLNWNIKEALSTPVGAVWHARKSKIDRKQINRMRELHYKGTKQNKIAALLHIDSSVVSRVINKKRNYS